MKAGKNLARGSAVSWVMRADGEVEGAVAVAITQPLYRADRHQRTRLVQQAMWGGRGSWRGWGRRWLGSGWRGRR